MSEKKYGQALNCLDQFIFQNLESYSPSEVISVHDSYLFILRLQNSHKNYAQIIENYLKNLHRLEKYEELVDLYEESKHHLIPFKNEIYSWLISSCEKVGLVEKEKKYSYEYLNYCLDKKLIQQGIAVAGNFIARNPLELPAYLIKMKLFAVINDLAGLEKSVAEVQNHFKTKQAKLIKRGIEKEKIYDEIDDMFKSAQFVSLPSLVINEFKIKKLMGIEEINFDETTEIKELSPRQKKEVASLFLENLYLGLENFNTYFWMIVFFNGIREPRRAKSIINFLKREYAEEVLANKSNRAKGLNKLEKLTELELQKNLESSVAEEDATMAFEDLNLSEMGKKSTRVFVYKADYKEGKIEKLKALLKEGDRVGALELAIELSKQFKDDIFLIKIREDLLELGKKQSQEKDPRKPSEARVELLDELSKVRSRFEQNSDKENLQNEKFVRREILQRLKQGDPADELSEITTHDKVIMFNDLLFFELSIFLIQEEMSKITSVIDEIEKFLRWSYLKINTLMKMGDYTKALIELENINNSLPLTKTELINFIYLEAECLRLTNKREQARSLYNEVIGLDENYRLAKERASVLK